MDRIVALYSNDYQAKLMRQHLYTDGFPTDRIDVVTWDEAGRFVDNPARSAWRG
jgi:hypothetical protein